MSDPGETKFASPDRSSAQSISSFHQLIDSKPLLTSTLDMIPQVILILDENRQVIYCNEELLHLLGEKSIEKVLGKRPGEVLGCIHSQDEKAGCGTSKFCAECGAVKAILKAQQGIADVQECRITVDSPSGEKSLNLRVWTKPLLLDGKQFTICIIANIEDEKKREALEKTFFHDILNVTSVISLYVDSAHSGAFDETEDIWGNLKKFVRRLIGEIQEQRDLLAAEKGDLPITFQDLPVNEFLGELVDFYKQHELSRQRTLTLLCPSAKLQVHSDKVMLGRVVGNLIKNALEASPEGGIVTIGYEDRPDTLLLYVNNSGVMPLATQLQIFQRAFTTKGKGRGLGTYGVKLLTEKYLQGKVSFASNPENGTTFFLEFKKN